MEINADNIWSGKLRRGRGGFLPSCDIETETGERVEKKRGDGLVPSGEERGIGSLRRRLQKDSRERGSGIFIIGIPVTVSKSFTALISVATVKEDTGCKKKKGERMEEGMEKKKKDIRWIGLVLLFAMTNIERRENLIRRQLCSSFVQRLHRSSLKNDRKRWLLAEDRIKSLCCKEKFDSSNISGSLLNMFINIWDYFI